MSHVYREVHNRFPQRRVAAMKSQFWRIMHPKTAWFLWNSRENCAGRFSFQNREKSTSRVKLKCTSRFGTRPTHTSGLRSLKRNVRLEMVHSYVYLKKYSAGWFDEFYPELSKISSPYLPSAQLQLFRFSRLLRHKKLNPVQEHPRHISEKFARPPPRGRSVCAQNDQSEVFMMIQNDRENVQDSESVESDEEIKAEEESKELANGDTNEMRLFRNLLR